MRAALKTAINLEKVMCNDRELIEKIFTKCKNMRYLEYVGFESMDYVLDNVERALFKTKKHRRNSVKIRIHTNIVKHSECIMKLNRIINALSMNPVDQWMLVLELRCTEETKRTNSFVKDLEECLTAEMAVVEDISNCMKMILITNPRCTICGSNESWLMNF